MKLDTWQVRLTVRVLKAGAYARQERRTQIEDAIAFEREWTALEAMAVALESGESLEVGP